MRDWGKSTIVNKCSRADCGKEFGLSDQIEMLHAWQVQLGVRTRKDLCNDCVEMLLNWLEGKLQLVAKEPIMLYETTNKQS